MNPKHQYIKIHVTERGSKPIEVISIHHNNFLHLKKLSEPHRNEQFAIVWIKSGGGVLTLDLDEISIESETIYCVTPGEVHTILFSQETQGYIIYFTPEFLFMQRDNIDLISLEGLFYTQGTLSVIKFDEAGGEAMEELILRVTRELENSMMLQTEMLRGLLKLFLIQLARCFKTPLQLSMPTRGIVIVKQFLLLLDKHFMTNRTVSFYANEIMVSANYLNEVVKKLTGYPVSYHIQQRVALEAKRQGKYEIKSMKEVAFMLGFEDSSHFSRFFKRNVGMNFSDFKKTNQAALG